MSTVASTPQANNIEINAISAIKEFSRQLNIKSIVYVDDRFSIENLKIEFLALMNNLKKHSPNEIDFIDWSFPSPVFARELNKYWDALGDEAKKHTIHLVCSVYDKIIGGDSLINLLPAISFSDLLPELVRCYTPKKWVKDKEEFLNGVNDDDKILCLFDFEFQNSTAPVGFKDGVDLAKNIIESKHSKKVYCGIFSHTFLVEEEKEYWVKYAQERDIDRADFYTISKKRFSTDPNIIGFAEGLKNALSINHIQLLKDTSINILDEAFSKVKRELQEVSPEIFNQIVVKSSHIEGVWEPFTFLRLARILLSYESKNALLPDDRREGLVKNVMGIRNLENVKTGDECIQVLDKELIVSLMQKEIYEEGVLINKLNSPIRNGDIFDIKGKLYMLLSQPCNISLRKEGFRGNNYNSAYLVELLKFTKSEGEMPRNRKYGFREKVSNYYGNDDVCLADFPSFKIVNLNLVDLVVFNENGIAKIHTNVANIETANIHSPWKKRYKSILKVYKRLEELYLALNNEGQNFKKACNRKMLKDFILNPDWLKDLKLGGNDIYNQTEQLFELKLKRVRHYREPYSNEILQKFMEYLSRNGFDHDLTRGMEN